MGKTMKDRKDKDQKEREQDKKRAQEAADAYLASLTEGASR